MTTTADKALMIAYSSTSTTKDVQDFFLAEMKSNGWEVVGSTEISAQDMVMYNFSKDTRMVVINVYGTGENQTYIQIVIDQQ